MASTGRQSPEALETRRAWRTAGDRIQTLLDASAGGGTVARERAEQLVGEVTDLYGAGARADDRHCRRIGDPELVDAFAADDLVASLMLVHGLHPHGVERRIEDALDSVRPYLGSHGGDVQLLEVVDATSVVRLQFAGSCKSCPSSAVTLELAVEDAVRAAAPEITSIEVVAAETESTAAVHPGGLADEPRPHQGTATPAPPGTRFPTSPTSRPGEVGGFLVAGMTVLACRIGDELFAYHDRCGRCGDSLAGAALHRRWERPSAEAVLRCPRCHAHFDVVHAGAGLDETRRVRRSSRPDPAAGTRRCAVDGGARRGDRGDGMTGAYDVLARIRASKDVPAAGRRALRDVRRADRRRASARRQCRRPPADVRRAAAAICCSPTPHAKLRYRAVPDRYLTFPDFALGPPRLGGTADSGRAGVLLPQLRRWTRRSRSIRARPAPPSPSWTSTPGTPFAAPTRGWTCSPTTSKPLLVRVPDDERTSRAADAIWCRSTPATSSSADCECCGTASTAARRSASSSTSSSSRSRRAARWRQPMTDVTFAVVDVAAGTVRGDARY